MLLLADEEAASEARLGRAREPRDAGKENPFTWLGCPVHPDCGAARPFDFKTQTTRVKYWPCLDTLTQLELELFSNPNKHLSTGIVGLDGTNPL